VKRLILLIALVVILPVLVVLDASSADITSADNEPTTGQTQSNNASASATITITMYAVADE